MDLERVLLGEKWVSNIDDGYFITRRGVKIWVEKGLGYIVNVVYHG